MTGSPPKVAFASERATANAEWRLRQQEFHDKEEAYKRMQKELNQQFLERHHARMDFQPGHGPTRWLWPTAHKHPRTWSTHALRAARAPSKAAATCNPVLFQAVWPRQRHIMRCCDRPYCVLLPCLRANLMSTLDLCVPPSVRSPRW